MITATCYEQQMNLNLPTIADIQMTDLIYYDEAYCAECYAFCKERDIDCLPSVDDPDTFFQRNDDSMQFDKQEITGARHLDAATFIFRPDLLARFQTHPLQFVFDHGTLTGVVHFSDYNQDVVSTFLYAQFAKYERELRSLIERSGLKREDMLIRFDELKDSAENNKRRNKYGRKRGIAEKNHKDHPNLAPFDDFYLDDLIDLAGGRKVIQLDDEVVALRNMIMHSRDSVNMADASTPDYIYRVDTFELFFKRVRVLLQDYRRIHTRLLIKTDSLGEDSK